jgi:hypothetical protein
MPWRCWFVARDYTVLPVERQKEKKFEYRNTNFETNPKFKSSNSQNILSFVFWQFDIVSDFSAGHLTVVLRISNLAGLAK